MTCLLQTLCATTSLSSQVRMGGVAAQHSYMYAALTRICLPITASTISVCAAPSRQPHVSIRWGAAEQQLQTGG